MKNPLQSTVFLKSYKYLPHRWLNTSFARLMTTTRPAWAVRQAISLWVRGAQIDLSDFESVDYPCLEAFFLRRLRPSARHLGDGLVSPVDGILVDQGPLSQETHLLVKGQRLSLPRLVGPDYDLAPFTQRGAHSVTVFLTPHGYHYIHAPAAGQLCGVRLIPGRFFPQNDRALSTIPKVYERNERAVLRFRLPSGHEILLILVGASLVGGIELRDLPRSLWAQPDRAWYSCDFKYEKGDEIAHFRFGSTVVMLLPAGLSWTWAWSRTETTGNPMGKPMVNIGQTLYR